MSLPPERVAELRQAIHKQVTRLGVQEQIQSCLAGATDKENPPDEATLLHLLEERGLVDQVMQSLRLSPPHMHTEEEEEEEEEVKCMKHKETLESVLNEEVLDKMTGETPPATKRGLHPNKRYLFLRVVGGRAFLDHLQHSQVDCTSSLTMHVCFRGRRVHSRAVPCTCEPCFSEGFLLEVTRAMRREDGRGGKSRSEGESRLLSFSEALSVAEPMRLVITRTNDRGTRNLLGTCSLDWRHVLLDAKGKWKISLEVKGVGTEAGISAGLLDMQVEIFPKSEPLQPTLLTAQLEMERQRNAERDRLFLVYAKQWWREYLQIRSDHTHRLVKIFTQDEVGCSRTVCTFVRPLRAGRLLDGPRHAARFVSLIPFEERRSVGMGTGGKVDVWCSLHTILCQRKGDVADHCILLCSLLLGYGLESYVCVGSKTQGLAHCWVVTIGTEGTVTFWESLTGQRYNHTTFDPVSQAGCPPPPPPYHYRTIGCLFNHTSFFANTQTSDSILRCSFDLRNRSLWKPMSGEAIQSVVRWNSSWLPWSLLPPHTDPLLSANEMEQELRTLMNQHRMDLGLSTVWDDTLSYLLSPALASYEVERCVGVTAGNQEFQDAVRGYVPEGHTFKGFPIQLTHRNTRHTFATCLRSPVCNEIAGCRGDRIRHAVCVKVYVYPEGIIACWTMFAVTYRCIL